MVKVKVSDGSIKVTGHAGDESVQEQLLVCEDVTILMQALEIGINPQFIQVIHKEPGNLEYKFHEPISPAIQLVVMSCIKMVVDTIKVLADQHPEYVEVIVE